MMRDWKPEAEWAAIGAGDAAGLILEGLHRPDVDADALQRQSQRLRRAADDIEDALRERRMDGED